MKKPIFSLTFEVGISGGFPRHISRDRDSFLSRVDSTWPGSRSGSKCSHDAFTQPCNDLSLW